VFAPPLLAVTVTAEPGVPDAAGDVEAQAAVDAATMTARAPAPNSEQRVRCPARTDLPAMPSPLSEKAPRAGKPWARPVEAHL
jgi:hypothetical protein